MSQLFGDLVSVLATPSSAEFIPELNRVASWMAGSDHFCIVFSLPVSPNKQATGIAGIAAVAGFTKEYCLNTSSARIGLRVREALFASTVKQEIGSFVAFL
jgi:hypothetical protein